MIEIQDVSKIIDHKEILQHIDLTIDDGEIFSLIGPNGAGKTTLVRLILNLYSPTTGKISVNHIPVADKEFGQEKYKIGFLLDNLGLFKDLSAWDNMEFFDRIYYPKEEKAKRRERIERGLKLVGLSEHAGSKITFFSRGMKQRLCLARALIHQPKLLILDEPLRGLDLEGQILVRNLLLQLKKEGCTIFVNSHNLDETQRIATQLAFIKEGRILDKGTTGYFLKKYQCGSLEEVYMKLIVAQEPA